jgi:hypothetical protein
MSLWRVVYLDAHGVETTVEVEATEAWSEGGRTAFLHRLISGDSMKVGNSLEVPSDRLLSYERL